MSNINNKDLARATTYLEENYKTHYEWLNDNSAVCKEYGLTNEEFLKIVSFELANNRAATTLWKEVLSTAVGLKDGIERTSIMGFYSENCFTKEDIYEATMYASHTFSKHVINNSHRDVIAHRFALCKQFAKTCETIDTNKQVANLLKVLGVPKSNLIFCFLDDVNLSLNKASQLLNKSEDEIESEIRQAIAYIEKEQLRIENEKHELYSKKIIESDSSERIAVTFEILRRMFLLITKEKAMIRYLFGIPDNLSEQNFENEKDIKLEETHTFGETANKFGVTVDRVCEAFLKTGKENIESSTGDSNFSEEEINKMKEEKNRTTYNIISLAKRLTPREEKVIRFRFGIPENLNEQDIENGKNYQLYPHTLIETAEEFNITRERVRQIESKLFRGIHVRRRSKRLRDYLD